MSDIKRLVQAGFEEPEFNDYPGYISTEHTVWCGGCTEWRSESSRTKTIMAKMMRREGWICTKNHGWLCPECKKKPR